MKNQENEEENNNNIIDILDGLEPGINFIRCKNCLCIPIISIVPKIEEIPKLKIYCNCGSYWKKINEFVSQFQITFLSKINCFYCKNKDIFSNISFCYDCNKILCKNCYNSHIFTFSEHIIKAFDLIEINCKKHFDQNLIGFCIDCDKFFCKKCKEDHMFHEEKTDSIKLKSINIKEIKENLNEAKKKINKFNYELKNKSINEYKKLNNSNEKIEEIESKYKYNNEINKYLLKIMETLLNMYEYYKKKEQIPYSLKKTIYKNQTFNLELFDVNYNEVSPEYYYKKIINYFKYDFIIKFSGERKRKKTNREIDYFELLERIVKLDKLNFGTSGTLILKDKRIATSAPNGDIIIFNQNLEKEYTIKGHSDRVMYLFQTDDEKLISCSADQTIKVWLLFNKGYNCQISFQLFRLRPK